MSNRLPITEVIEQARVAQERARGPEAQREAEAKADPEGSPGAAVLPGASAEVEANPEVDLDTLAGLQERGREIIEARKDVGSPPTTCQAS